MDRNQLVEIKERIENNIGALSASELYAYYNAVMNGADMFLLGVELNGNTFGYYTENIPMQYIKTQTDHRHNVQYIRFRPHDCGAMEIIENNDIIYFGATAEVYVREAGKKLNKGYSFERAVYAHYNRANEWTQDNKPSYECGDIVVDGKQVQIKFAPRRSMATITSTKKIVNRINELLANA